MLHRLASQTVMMTLALGVWGGFAAPAQAGVIPWMYNAVFGPVGSMRGGYSAGYAGGGSSGGCCNYGPAMASPCGGCSPCGGGGCGFGGCSTGNCGGIAMGGGCASGQCGVNFTPDAGSSNLAPVPDSNVPRGPAPTPAAPTPTFQSPAPRTNVKPNIGGTSNEEVVPKTLEEDFPNSGPSSIPANKKGPAPGGRPAFPKDEGTAVPRPMLDVSQSVVTWRSAMVKERVSTRSVASRSVEVTREGAYPNSRWEPVSTKPSVASK